MVRFLTTGSVIGALVGAGLMVTAVGAAAQDEISATGNGGTAECSANGGAVATGDVNSGGNVGSTISIGDSWGDVAVDGGSMANATNLSVAANGGVGICDASV
jgi:hypothetical protein